AANETALASVRNGGPGRVRMGAMGVAVGVYAAETNLRKFLGRRRLSRPGVVFQTPGRSIAVATLPRLPSTVSGQSRRRGSPSTREPAAPDGADGARRAAGWRQFRYEIGGGARQLAGRK